MKLAGNVLTATVTLTLLLCLSAVRGKSKSQQEARLVRSEQTGIVYVVYLDRLFLICIFLNSQKSSLRFAVLVPFHPAASLYAPHTVQCFLPWFQEKL